VRALRMLDGVYGAAFDCFLKHAEFSWPASIHDPIVGLFLLVCDMAINPGEGFPLPLRSPATFITDVDPGIRFFYGRGRMRTAAIRAREIRSSQRRSRPKL